MVVEAATRSPLAAAIAAAAVAPRATCAYLGGDPLTIDPGAQASDSGLAAYIVEIFGGLVTLDQNLKIVPDLA